VCSQFAYFQASDILKVTNILTTCVDIRYVLGSLRIFIHRVRLRLKRDGTRTDTRFRLSGKRTSPFKSAGASVQSTTGSRAVRISGSNAGYTMFQGSVKVTRYPLHSPVSSSRSLPCVTVCQPSRFNGTLTHVKIVLHGTI
jgi:hypothetical protein